MLSNNNTSNKELTIYTAYINDSVLDQFTLVNFRHIDSSDIPAMTLKVLSFLIGVIGGAHLHNPLTNMSMPDLDLLSMSISSLKELYSKRGKVIIPLDKFPHIDPLYVMANVADWIQINEENLLEPKFNPFYRNKLTYIPTLKKDWSIVYIVSLRPPQKFEKKGLDHGYITLTRNDAIQLCELIIKGEYPPPFSSSIKNTINNDDYQSDKKLVKPKNMNLDFEEDHWNEANKNDTYFTQKETARLFHHQPISHTDKKQITNPIAIPQRIGVVHKNDSIFYNNPDQEMSEDCVLNKKIKYETQLK